MQAVNGQTVTELAQRIAELAARVAELTRRVELADGVNGNGVRSNALRGQETDAAAREADDSSCPIEFITENGFSIVRPWELGNAPAPADGRSLFRVSDARGDEREVAVEFSPLVVAQISLHTRGRVQLSSSFWICCAERRLANYVWEHDAFPDGNRLILESMDPEDVLLAIRWGST